MAAASQPLQEPAEASATTGGIIAIGIDVGGPRKGFHAVALRDGAYAGQWTSTDPQALAHWCSQTMGARLIAIDAPSQWSTDDHMRPCERALLQQGIRCFASPSRRQAIEHPSGYFDWMLQGEALYQALAPDYPLCAALPPCGRGCFETFPHAITWHLRGGDAAASQKRRQRRELLSQAGIDLTPLRSIDWIDAALCALTAHRAASGGNCLSYGNAGSGLIVVPAG